MKKYRFLSKSVFCCGQLADVEMLFVVTRRSVPHGAQSAFGAIRVGADAIAPGPSAFENQGLTHSRSSHFDTSHPCGESED